VRGAASPQRRATDLLAERRSPVALVSYGRVEHASGVAYVTAGALPSRSLIGLSHDRRMGCELLAHAAVNVHSVLEIRDLRIEQLNRLTDLG
jgi:hypothetical protein